MNHAALQGSFVNKDTGEIVTLKTKRNKTVLDLSDQDANKIAKAARYSIQNISGELLPNERVGKCMKVTLSNSVDSHVCLHPDGKKSGHYSGLIQCGSVWDCPVCSAKISERRSQELREALKVAIDKGYHVSHVTFTFPHGSRDSLKENLSSFLDAFKRFWDSAPIRRFKNDYGLIGRVRALEVTHSDKNGFHPHIHLLCFTSKKLTVYKYLQQEFLKVWNDKLARVGLGLANDHGIKIQNGDKAGEYISKFGDDSKLLKTKDGDEITWDMADEIAKLNVKRGRGESMTPFDFLRVIESPETFGYTASDVPRFKKLFKEYSECFKGKSQLEWGRGKLDLRKNLELAKELTDEETVSIEDQQQVISTIQLPLIAWRRMRPTSKQPVDFRALFNSVHVTSGKEAAYKFLKTALFRDLSQKVFNDRIVNFKPSSS